MKPKQIPIIEGNTAAAFESATEQIEPVFVPAPIHADDRGWSIMNQLQGLMDSNGQINYSVVYPNVIKAWHRHRLQTDFWLCVGGNIKVGVHRESDGTSWMGVVGERRSGMVIIPPPLWHGLTPVGNQPAGLLYYVTHAYNHKEPDEDRRSYDSIEGFPWGIQHG